jgi:U3 small nucleolar RNA-associated protein 23
MRHLYACNKEPGVAALIERAKTYERRRCGHLPEEYPEPLSALECLKSVVDPKGSGHNKNRYVVASQEQPVRKAMRGVLGVPLVYINRSVMIMEPMAGASAENRDKAEKQKFREGLKGRESGSQTMKRKRTDEDGEGAQEQDAEAGDATPKKKKTHQKGPKGPNPLAVKKAKKPIQEGTAKPPQKPSSTAPDAKPDGEGEQDEAGAKRKRRRKHKSGVGEAAGGEVGQLNEANGEE